jgi:hypothetical protein
MALLINPPDETALATAEVVHPIALIRVTSTALGLVTVLGLVLLLYESLAIGPPPVSQSTRSPLPTLGLFHVPNTVAPPSIEK